jgi:DNA-binding CsgD family transcriptional regulator/tetratricopeptide (TPR) repeat protein
MSSQELEVLEAALESTRAPTDRARLEAELSRELAQTDPMRAIHLAESAILTAETHREDTTIALALRGLAEARRNREELLAAVEALERAQSIYERLGDTQGILACLTGLATTYTQAEQFNQAIRFFDQALSLADQVGDTWLEAQLLNSLSNMYANLGDKVRAVELVERSLNKLNAEERPHAYARRLYNLGWLQIELDQNDLARANFEQALEIAERKHEPEIETLALESLAVLHKRNGQRNKAIELLTRARDVARAAHNVSQEIEVLRELALLLETTDSIASGATLERLLDLLITQDRWHSVAETHLQLSEHREILGDYAGALEQYKRFHHANARGNSAVAAQQQALALRFDAHKASEEIAGLHKRALEVVELLSKLKTQSNALMHSTTSADPSPHEGVLTPRELEILRLIAQGRTNKTVAKTLGISSHTVGFHLSAVFRKLGVRGRTQAVAAVTRSGLLR